MLAEQRRGLILNILAEKGSVSVTDLFRHLQVSREMIRRDINRLAAEILGASLVQRSWRVVLPMMRRAALLGTAYFFVFGVMGAMWWFEKRGPTWARADFQASPARA